MFQRRVDATLGSDQLQFTATMWRAYKPEPVQLDPRLVVVSDPLFLFLDMAMSWNRNGCLSFSVFPKPNQELKYLNLGSTHTSATFKAIPNGVALRLALLTTVDESTKDKSLSSLYPDHFAAPKSAGLCTDDLPSVEEVVEKYKSGRSSAKDKKILH